MEQFLNKKVEIDMCLGGLDGSGQLYRGTVTSCDDEFLCLDNKKFILRKFIMAITIN